MKLKEMIKSYSFWTALAGALVVLVQILGRIFNFSIPNELVNDLVMAIAGVLVACGVVTLPKSTTLTGETSSDDKKTDDKKVEEVKTQKDEKENQSDEQSKEE